MKDRLDGVIKEEIEAFKGNHYAKSFIHIKSYKRASGAFAKGQGPWLKRKAKILKYQKAQQVRNFKINKRKERKERKKKKNKGGG